MLREVGALDLDLDLDLDFDKGVKRASKKKGKKKKKKKKREKARRKKMNHLRLLRGAFSVLEPGAHLQVHAAPSNTRLKLHVGLLTPRTTDGRACAYLRVANTTKGWLEQDQVLFFDDSYEHEAWNMCDGPGMERAVFQLVFEHPDARA